MNNEQNLSLADTYLSEDARKYARLVSVPLTVEDCAFVHALLSSHWGHPDLCEYSDELMAVPDQIEHCVNKQGLKEPFDYERQQWAGRLTSAHQLRLRKLIEFFYDQDMCGTIELAKLATEVIGELMDRPISQSPD